MPMKCFAEGQWGWVADLQLPKELDVVHLAQIARDAFYMKPGTKETVGDPGPWEELAPVCQQVWIAVAEAVTGQVYKTLAEPVGLAAEQATDDSGKHEGGAL